MYGLIMKCDGAPSRGLLEQAINDVVLSNVAYFIAEWSEGRDPPCCLGCAGIKHVPDVPSRTAEIVGARGVLQAGQASCQSAAAYFVGRERAIELSKGECPESVHSRYRVVLEEKPRADAPGGYWHALAVTPKGIVDVTEEMS